MTPNQLRATREKVGLTPAAFAAKLGVSERTLYRYETGDIRISAMAERAIAHLLQELTGAVPHVKVQPKTSTSRRPAALRNSNSRR